MVVANKSQIKSTAIYKVTSKTDGKACWAVPSDSSDAMYKVCFNEERQQWECDCIHGQVQADRGQGARCKHVGAVQTSITANKPVVKETSQKGVLNGNGNTERKMEQAPSGRMVWMR